MIEVAVVVAMTGIDPEEHFLYLAPFSDRREGPESVADYVNGTRIEGVIPIDRPREQSRISDVLNDTSELFIRIDDEEQTYYVNKAFLRSVIPR